MSVARPPESRKPDWLKVRLPSGTSTRQVGDILSRHGLHTVCDEAHCPNKAECWGQATATFMVMGSICTRNCRFCAVATGKRGEPLCPEEPEELAAAVLELGLRYAVITSVDRDDLADRGASHFAACVRAIRARDPSIGIEVLAPDFREGEIELLLEAGLDVFAHNIETVERLERVRDARASYRGSLHTLALASAWAGSRGRGLGVKSSLLLGLGENEEEVLIAMDDLRAVGTTSLVLGQYLRPSPRQLPVEEYLSPETFDRYRELALARGFTSVVSTPLARTSYHARSAFEGTKGRTANPLTGGRLGEARMILRLDHKVEGGKLLRLELLIEKGNAIRVLVKGDFFAHPEELFEEAEASLAGIAISELPEAARRAFTRPGLSLQGLSPEAIAAAITRVLRERDEVREPGEPNATPLS